MSTNFLAFCCWVFAIFDQFRCFRLWSVAVVISQSCTCCESLENMARVTRVVLYHTRGHHECSQYNCISAVHSKCNNFVDVCIVKILQDFECQFPNAKDRFIAAFEANIVPAALKLAGASKNESIRLLSLLPTGATSG